MSSPNLRFHRTTHSLSYRDSRKKEKNEQQPLSPATSLNAPSLGAGVAAATATPPRKTSTTATSSASNRNSLDMSHSDEQPTASPNLATPTSITPDRSRRASSIRLGKEEPAATEEAAPPPLPSQPQAASSRHHQHSHQHGHNKDASHSTGIAALAAAAAAVATASPSNSIPIPASAAAAAASRKAGDSDGRQDGAQEDAKEEAVIIDPVAARAAKERQRNIQKKQERDASHMLQETLGELDGLSSTTSRRLDDTYRSVLSRVTTLQGTVLALRSLAAAARATNRRFTAETQALEAEIEQQISAFGDEAKEGEAPRGGTPSDQQKRLVELHDRVRAGRQQVLDLSDRVDAVRLRVEHWGLADRAWQERTRTRLKFLWLIVLGVILTLVVLLFMSARYTGGGGEEGVLNSTSPAQPFSLHFIEPTPTGTNASDRDNPLVHLLDEL